MYFLCVSMVNCQSITYFIMKRWLNAWALVICNGFSPFFSKKKKDFVVFSSFLMLFVHWLPIIFLINGYDKMQWRMVTITTMIIIINLTAKKKRNILLKVCSKNFISYRYFVVLSLPFFLLLLAFYSCCWCRWCFLLLLNVRLFSGLSKPKMMNYISYFIL